MDKADMEFKPVKKFTATFECSAREANNKYLMNYKNDIFQSYFEKTLYEYMTKHKEFYFKVDSREEIAEEVIDGDKKKFMFIKDVYVQALL